MALFSDAQTRLADVFQHISLSDDIRERLANRKLSLLVSIPVRMDDGSLRVFTGYRVQFDDTRGPTKGGVRFHPKVTLDEVTSLSFWMTIKCAVQGFGNAGFQFARLAQQAGYCIVAVSDSKGAVYSEAGLDVDKIMHHKRTCREFNEKLKIIMDKEANLIFDRAKQIDISIRTAAYIHGVQRIAGAISEKGTREYFQIN